MELIVKNKLAGQDGEFIIYLEHEFIIYLEHACLIEDAINQACDIAS